MVSSILKKRLNGERISSEECFRLFQSKDLLSIGQAANALVGRLEHAEKVTYIVDRNINYTNECVAECDFCAFYRKPGEKDAYILSREELSRKIDDTLAKGGKQILLQGGLSPHFGIEEYEDLFRWIKQHYPDLHIHGLSPPEIHYAAKKSHLSLRDAIRRLRDAGLNSIPGGGAEILVEKVRRKISSKKCSAAEWISVMEAAHSNGLKSSATMMFGHIESLHDRVEHLYQIRALQDRTGGFTAFIPWTFQSQNTQLEGKTEKASSHDYLKTLAISRIFLDNFENIQASWVTQGAKIAELSLYYGANDIGSVMMEENVVRSAGTSFRLSEKNLHRLIWNVSKTPARRDIFYNIEEVIPPEE